MPYIPLVHPNDDLILGMWKVEEEEDYFFSRLNIYENEARILANLRRPSKRKEWLSSRLCLKELLHIQHPVESLNEATGRPYLTDHSFQISYSHSNNLYSGAIASDKGMVSMDLEDLSKKRNPETSYLFMHPEELEYFKKSGDPRVFFLIWSAKETLYKLYAKRGLVFKEDLRVNPEESPLVQDGIVNGWIKLNGITHIFPIFYRFLDDVLLTYSFAHGVRE